MSGCCAAADELRYRPNALAKSLRRRVTHTIAFIGDEIVTTPYAGAMIQGAQDVAHEFGYMLLLANTGNDAELEEQLILALLDRQVDGAVYATMFHRFVEVPASLGSTTVVLLDARSDDPSYVVGRPRRGRRGPGGSRASRRSRPSPYRVHQRRPPAGGRGRTARGVSRRARRARPGQRAGVGG